MFKIKYHFLCIVTFVVALFFVSCQKENISHNPPINNSKTEQLTDNTTFNEEIISGDKSVLIPPADFVIKVVGVNQPVKLYLSTPGQPIRTITSTYNNGDNQIKFGLGNFYNRINRNVTYTLSPVPTNWPGHQIRFNLSNSYTWSNCYINGPTTYDTRIWYLGNISSRQFLYAYPSVAGASITFF